MTAYYNEHDPFTARWLRELIKAGHIPAGDVDERSIEDVAPDDLTAYSQCHFFAGIGGWPHAIRLAGWADDRPVWTGSAPCQPFSAAGKGAGFADERHLWPAWFWLISQCRPPTIFGEQVSSAAGRAWFDVVSSDLEAHGYACGAVDLCAAGVGAPHIRQRLWWVGERLDDAAGARHDRALGRAEGTARDEARLRVSGAGRGSCGLADSDNTRLEGRREPGRECAAELAAGAGSVAGGMADTDGGNASTERVQRIRQHGCEQKNGGASSGAPAPARKRDYSSDGYRSGPTNGLWADADWLFCRDGEWRPVEPGTFPLAHGAAERVGRLRGYGNAIVPPLAAEFVSAYMERAR